MKKLITKVTIGSDPEIFIVDTNTKLLVSAIDKIGGTKWVPRDLGDGYAVQEDNVLAEINIPPAKTEDEFLFAITRGIELLKKALPSDNLDLLIAASGFMPASELEDERALMFGCDPDFNAWLGGMANNFAAPENKTLRSAGGHIHVGFSLTDKTIQMESVGLNIVKQMDKYLGVPSIILDKDTERRKLYGKAGAFRNKSYGVEYRTLSSFWLADQATTRWAYRQTQKAIQKANDHDFIPDEIGKQIQEIINTANVSAAQEFVKEHERELV